jgi:hypothetical protein
MPDSPATTAKPPVHRATIITSVYNPQRAKFGMGSGLAKVAALLGLAWCAALWLLIAVYAVFGEGGPYPVVIGLATIPLVLASAGFWSVCSTHWASSLVTFISAVLLLLVFFLPGLVGIPFVPAGGMMFLAALFRLVSEIAAFRKWAMYLV